MSKRYFVIACTFLLATTFVSALTNHFNFDSSKLNFSVNSKKNNLTNSFNSDYYLSTSVISENKELKDTIVELSKKTTSLLLGDINTTDESNEHYYNRHKEYENLAAYNYFPKDSNSASGYDETIENYNYVVASELAIPQLFYKFNELGIIYKSYGDIRVTINGNLAISMVLLPNVKIKEENLGNCDVKEENLILYYYFIKIDDEYRLCYLYGEYGDNVQKYFEELENNENVNSKAIVSSYESELSNLYDYTKLNAVSSNIVDDVYNKNINNLVYLSSYYNNEIVSNANGFLISDGIVVTTWTFLEKALMNSQFISIRGSNLIDYEIDGVITVNPEIDIAVIKLKNQISSSVEVGNFNKIEIEDPTMMVSSKSGVGYTIQKGIIVANDGYIQTTIPVNISDDGSPLFNMDGQIIGMNTSKTVNSSISMAINSSVLNEIKEKFSNIDFDSIKTIKFEQLKENYYYLKFDTENVINTIPKKIWAKYSKIGNIEENIRLELVKASYDNGIVSLRYKNRISNYINTMQLAATYKEQLLNDGYEVVLNSSSKCIYRNKKYQVILMNEFDYLIVIMVKL